MTPVLLNTVLGGVAGGMTSVVLFAVRDGAVPPPGLANGIMGGLVGITAAASLASPQTGLFLGTGGGTWLLWRWQIDDGVGPCRCIWALTSGGPSQWRS